MKKRKQVTMLVTVSVPGWMTAAMARMEVRSLISHQCNYSAYTEVDDVKVRSVKPAKGVKP